MKTPLKLLILSVLILVLNIDLSAQVTGKGVITLKGKPLESATVFLKGTIQGTYTNSKGEFELTCDPPEASAFYLLIRAIGIKPTEILYGSKDNLSGEILMLNFTSKRKYEMEWLEVE